MLRSRWTALALTDFAEGTDYIAQESRQAAQGVARRVWAATQQLQHNPYMGRPGRVQGTREWVIAATPYLLAYRVEKNRIVILRVLHAARRWPERMPS